VKKLVDTHSVDMRDHQRMLTASNMQLQFMTTSYLAFDMLQSGQVRLLDNMPESAKLGTIVETHQGPGKAIP